MIVKQNTFNLIWLSDNSPCNDEDVVRLTNILRSIRLLREFGQYTTVSQLFGSVFCSLYVLTYQCLAIVSKPKSLNELYLACHVFPQSLLKPISLDIKRQHLKITTKSIYTGSGNFSMEFRWFPNRPNAKARKNALRNTHKHYSSSPVQIAKRNRYNFGNGILPM